METPSQKTRKFDIQRGVILAVLIFLGLAWIYLLHADQQAFFFRGLGQAFALFLTIFLGILLTIYLLISKGWETLRARQSNPRPLSSANHYAIVLLLGNSYWLLAFWVNMKDSATDAADWIALIAMNILGMGTMKLISLFETKNGALPPLALATLFASVPGFFYAGYSIGFFLCDTFFVLGCFY